MNDDLELGLRLSRQSYELELQNSSRSKRIKFDNDKEVIKIDLSSSSPEPSTSTKTGGIELNVSPFDFDLKVIDKPVRFSLWTQACLQCSYTTSRKEIMNILTNFFRLILYNDKDCLLSSLWLFNNKLGPSYESDELGIGPQIFNKCIKDLSTLSAKGLKKFHTLGDVGDYAYEALKNNIQILKPKPLTVNGVYETLSKITKFKGPQSRNMKIDSIKKLLVAAQGEEIRYLMRIFAQNLRIGAVRTTILLALGKAFLLNEHKRLEDVTNNDIKEVENLMRKVFARHPNFNTIVHSLLHHGLTNLESNVQVAVGTPIQPMLGAITRSLEDVNTKLGDRQYTSQAKLDGQRCQIHAKIIDEKEFIGNGWKSTNTLTNRNGFKVWIRLFSRHLEDMTEKYPDILITIYNMFNRNINLENFILDSEITAIDIDTKQLKTFQDLSNRSKVNVDINEIKVAVGIFCFDIMYFNNEPLLSQSLRNRRQTMIFNLEPYEPDDKKHARFLYVPFIDDSEPQILHDFFQKCLKMKAEGIMVKLLDEYEVVNEDNKKINQQRILPATYEPDKRSDSWLKVKKDYVEGLSDSLDLVPVGADHGMGRKNKFWSPIYLACYDEEEGVFSVVCKIMSGFSDAFYQSLSERYDIKGDKTSYKKSSLINAGDLKPDIWFEPSEVWEIKGADLTLSPVYPAAQGHVSERGISLRFPRFLKIRDDKSIYESSTSKDIANMFQIQ